MMVYIPLTVLTIALALLVGRARAAVAGVSIHPAGRSITRQTVVDRIALGSIFVALFLVSALRLNVGNDYGNYVEFMHLADVHAYVPTEWGFNNLTRFVYLISGYENYLAVFAIFAAVTIALFMAALYELSEDFTLSFIMFMLLGYYFQSLSTVRYYLALAVAIYSMRFVLRRDWPRFVVTVCLGALFHRSLLLVLVMYPLAQLRWRRWMYAGVGMLCVLSLFIREELLELVLRLYPTYADTAYLSGGTSLVAIARCVLVIAAILFIYRGKKGGHLIRWDRLYNDRVLYMSLICNMLALLLYTFGSFLPTVSRIAYYLTVTQLLAVPALVCRIPVTETFFLGKNRNLRTAVKSVIVAGCLVYFVMYMRGAAGPGVRILPYQTFLFHELPPMVSDRGGTP